MSQEFVRKLALLFAPPQVSCNTFITEASFLLQFPTHLLFLYQSEETVRKMSGPAASAGASKFQAFMNHPAGAFKCPLYDFSTLKIFTQFP